jgi:hypothetical protein
MEMLEKEKQEIGLRQERFKALLPQLASINNRHKDKPVVKYYEGKEGILSMVSEHTKSSRGHEVCNAYSRDVIVGALGEDVLKNLVQNRLAENIKSRVIYTWSKGDFVDPPNTESVHLSPEELPMSCDIAIYEDKIRIASLKDRLMGVVIEDKEIAKSFKAIYDLAWKWVQSQKK